MSQVLRKIRFQSLMEWLVDPRLSVSPEVRVRLADQLLSSPGAVIMGALSGLLINVAAIFLHYRFWFLALAVAEVVCGIMRLVVIRAILTARERGAHAPIHRAALMSIIWCTLQGTMAFVSMESNVPTLQILSATLIMGIVGPICARNYPAPRLAILLVCLCDFPFVAGACTAGNRWLLVILPLMPMFLYGCWQIIVSTHAMAVVSLNGELAGRHLARHDPLTGLLNRYGLSEILREVSFDCHDTVLLCLDLDGFKRVNDDFGHHAGDGVLKAIAARLEGGVRAGDAIVRMGGDEFIVLARGMSSDKAAAFAQGLISLIMSKPYVIANCPPIWIGVSIGFACSPHDAIDAEDLHRKADAALYVAKAAGKGVSRRSGAMAARTKIGSDLISAA